MSHIDPQCSGPYSDARDCPIHNPDKTLSFKDAALASARNKVVECKSEDGITVGLIDAVISICRILGKRDLLGSTSAIMDALADLRNDADVRMVCDLNVERLIKALKEGGI